MQGNYAGAAGAFNQSKSVDEDRRTLNDRVASLRDDYAEIESVVTGLETRLERLLTRPLHHNMPATEEKPSSTGLIAAAPPTSEVGREVDALGIGIRRLTGRLTDLRAALDL